MVRSLLRVVLLVIIVAAIAAFFVGYRFAHQDRASAPDYSVGTSGSASVDRAREAGAEIGAKVAEGAVQAERLAKDAGVTAKIRSKMALDDTLDSSGINVDTTGDTVTLKGSVPSETDRQRAVQLARETEGVTSVVDQLSVR
jgi:hyperosmotically inducible protein